MELISKIALQVWAYQNSADIKYFAKFSTLRIYELIDGKKEHNNEKVSSR